jgi:hypothetical protein
MTVTSAQIAVWPVRQAPTPQRDGFSGNPREKKQPLKVLLV